jgi:hypothetical protein
LPKVPVNGFYKYRTNPNPDTVPWIMTGALRVIRLLDDFEVSSILEKLNIESPNRQGGNKTIEELGF